MKPAAVVRLLGWLAVAAMLCLTSPGVRVVRAEQPAPVSEIPAGPTCSDSTLGTTVVSVSLPSPEEVARRNEQQARPQVVPLDGGGNRYGGPEEPAPARRAE